MARRPFLDRDDPFFRKSWVRWVTTLAPLPPAAIELWTGNPGWAILFFAAFAYAGWVLILNRRGS